MSKEATRGDISFYSMTKSPTMNADFEQSLSTVLKGPKIKWSHNSEFLCALPSDLHHQKLPQS